MHRQINARCDHAWSGVSGYTGTRLSTREAFISFNAVERLYSRFWLKRLSLSSKSGGHTRQTCGKHCLSTVLVLLTLTGRQNVCYVVLQFYSTTHFHISWSFLQRAAYVSVYKPIWISLTFRQVPVGIYNTFITRSSLSTALTLNASATNWTDTFFSRYFRDCWIFKARQLFFQNSLAAWSITLQFRLIIFWGLRHRCHHWERGVASKCSSIFLNVSLTFLFSFQSSCKDPE